MNGSRQTESEQVAKSLVLQLAQATLDKTFLEVRLSILVEHVQEVLQTTQWAVDDNGVSTPVVAAEPLQRLHTLVYGATLHSHQMAVPDLNGDLGYAPTG